jgi:protein tyrosine phosphatase
MANPGPASTTNTPLANVSSNEACRLLAVLKGVDLNVVGDNALKLIDTSKFSVFQVVITNASTNLTTAHCSVYTGAGATGTAIVADAVMTGLTGSTIVDQRTVASTAVVSKDTIYFRVGTAQGAAATCDVRVFGYALD